MDLVVGPLAALALTLAAAAGSARAVRQAGRDLDAEAQRLPALRDQIDGLRAELGARRDAIGLQGHR
jgi:hypothetical protein